MAYRHRLILLVVGLVTAALYAPVASAPFVYEDEHHFRDALTWRIPGRALSVWSIRQTPDPGAAHLVNVGIHLVNGGLLAAVVTPLAGPVAAIGASVVLLWHPLNVQAVAYVTGRADLLLTFGVLVALAAAVRRVWWRFPVVAVGLVVAMASKEIGVVAVPLVLLTWLCFEPQVLRSHLAVALWIGAGAALGAAWASLTTWIAMTAASGGAYLPWPEFVLRQIALTWALLGRVVWPVGFSIDHDALALSSTACLIGGLLTLQVLALIAACWSRAPRVAWALAVVVLALAPRVLVGSSEFVAERHLYLPMVGVAALLGLGLARYVTPAASFWDTYHAQYRAHFPQDCTT